MSDWHCQCWDGSAFPPAPLRLYRMPFSNRKADIAFKTFTEWSFRERFFENFPTPTFSRNASFNEAALQNRLIGYLSHIFDQTILLQKHHPDHMQIIGCYPIHESSENFYSEPGLLTPELRDLPDCRMSSPKDSLRSFESKPFMIPIIYISFRWLSDARLCGLKINEHVSL